MIINQKWLITDPSAAREEKIALCASEGCCGFFDGIPSFLSEQAKDERWSLPHIWTETVVIPEPEEVQLTSVLEQV